MNYCKIHKVKCPWVNQMCCSDLSKTLPLSECMINSALNKAREHIIEKYYEQNSL